MKIEIMLSRITPPKFVINNYSKSYLNIKKLKNIENISFDNEWEMT